jgi:PAT family beta-lactamase induction signal transducer AmpG
MNLSRPVRYAMFALLYFAQGAIVAYFAALNSLYLLSYGLTMQQVGVIGTIALIPFVLKIFLGMLSDRFSLLGMGHRKPYIIVGLLIQAGFLLVIMSVNPASQYGLFAALAFIIMTGQALYDTCTDGLALDTTPKEEMGTIQGFMVGGRAMGVVIISGLIGVLVEATSWQAAFILLAVLTLVPLPLVLFLKEGARPAERSFKWGAFKAFGNLPVLTLALLGAVYSFVTNGANELFNPLLQHDFDISIMTAGLVTTAWGIGVVLGGLTGGRLVDAIGQRKAVLSAMTITTLSLLAMAAISSTAVAFPVIIFFGLAYGYYETVYFAISMNKTDPRIAASMFSIFMAIANIGTGIGLSAADSLADGVGFRMTFVILAGINLLALVLVPVIFGRAKQPAGQEVTSAD